MMKKQNSFLRVTLILSLLLSGFFLEAQIVGGYTENTPYDLSDFKPMTAEDFLAKNFVFLKQEYDINPATLIKGYRIEVIPAKRQGFRPSVSNHQIYADLVTNSVLEWAKQNNYTVYLDNGYRIVQKLNDNTEISVLVSPSFSSPRFNKTIEQEFNENHNTNWNNQTSGWSVIYARISSLHGLKSFEKEILAITDSKLKDECQKKINQNTQSGNNSHEESVDAIKSFSNQYVGNIELIRSKYGEVSGQIIINRKTNGTKGDLTPLKDMLSSMLTFCDHKIATVRTLFAEKNNTN